MTAFRPDSVSTQPRNPARVEIAVPDGFIHVNVSVADLDVEAAGRVRAYPRLIVNRRSPGAEIGQRHQVAGFALLTLRQYIVHPTFPSPESPRLDGPRMSTNILPRPRANKRPGHFSSSRYGMRKT